MTPEHKHIARAAIAHADQVDRDLTRVYPNAWELMERMRASRGTALTWPDWCLLPMGAAVAVAGTNPRAMTPYTSARLSASYAWRYTRSVYLFEPGLLDRLLTQIPDVISLGDLAGLPEWCIFIPGEHPEFPGAGLWAHLEHDGNTGRPELRLILDMGEEPFPIPVYLDRDSTTEALADYRATVLASIGRRGANVRGGELDAAAALLAEKIDGYLGVLAYLARPEADIVHAERPGARPVKPRRPKRDTDVWLVGYSA